MITTCQKQINLEKSFKRLQKIKNLIDVVQASYSGQSPILHQSSQTTSADKYRQRHTQSIQVQSKYTALDAIPD